jgi:hypothetical protein
MGQDRGDGGASTTVTAARATIARMSDDPIDELIDLTCPRCAHPAAQRFYGPCTHCRDELRATIVGEARELEASDYEPKVNVTPNAIATKE